jgi:ribosomal protein L16 Arg81 hydroxylase
MTLSVGCRAPSVSDLVSRLAENLALSIEDIAVRRYSDEDLLSRGFSTNFLNGHLTHEAKHKARQLVLESVNSMLENDDWKIRD